MHHPNDPRSSRMHVSRPLALPLVALLVALTACADGSDGDAAPATKTPTTAERGAEATPAAEEENGDVDTAATLIGRTLPPYPQGLSEVQGVCVPGGEQLERICDYGLALLGYETIEPAPTGVYLIASANAEPDAKQPLWRVTDALDAPQAKAGYELQLGGCRLDGALRNDIVALVRFGEGEYSSDIVWAKHLDIATGKFVGLELARVDCVNVGYGV